MRSTIGWGLLAVVSASIVLAQPADEFLLEDDLEWELDATATYTISGDYIPTRPAYRHVALRPLPKTPEGAIDIEQVVTEASLTAPELSPGVRGAAQSVVEALAAGDTKVAMSRWKETLESLKTDVTPLDLNALMRYILREAYLSDAPDLQFYAMNVRYVTEQKKDLREWLQEARRVEEELPADCGNDSDLCSLRTDLDELIECLEGERVSRCGADSDEITTKFEATEQKHKQVIDLMSRVLKTMHELAVLGAGSRSGL